MYIKRYIIILFLIAFLGILNVSYGRNSNYILLNKKGTLYLYRNGRLTLVNNTPKSLAKNDIVITKNDSSAVFKFDGRYIKIFSYSKLVVKKTPLLIYGKLQISKNRKFYEPHYSVYSKPREGETTKILLWGFKGHQSISGKVVYKGERVEDIYFYKIDHHYYKALIGIPLGISNGKYKFRISINGHDRYSLIKYPFYMKKRPHPTGRVRLDAAKESLLLPSEEKTREQEVLKKVVEARVNKQYWRGKFIYPVKNPRIISGFGKKRKYYIGGSYLYQRYHYGIDFSGARGTEVYAPNAGVIVFTGDRITTGKTIVISHGLGVFSLFFHLDEIDVEKSDFVGKGSLIGRMGSTGLAENPHLHWGLWVNMVYVDPLQWIKQKF